MSKKDRKWQERIQQIKEELSNLGDIRPGTLSEQYNVCGKPNCRCKDPNDPKKHGPYYQLSYTHKGKSTTEFVKKDMVAQVRCQIRNYAKFKKLTEEWIDLSIRIARYQKQHSGQKGMRPSG
jgi:hypothetical protein